MMGKKYILVILMNIFLTFLRDVQIEDDLFKCHLQN